VAGASAAGANEAAHRELRRGVSVSPAGLAPAHTSLIDHPRIRGGAIPGATANRATNRKMARAGKGRSAPLSREARQSNFRCCAAAGCPNPLSTSHQHGPERTRLCALPWFIIDAPSPFKKDEAGIGELQREWASPHLTGNIKCS